MSNQRYEDYLCPLTGQQCDLNICNVILDGMEHLFAPLEYTERPDYREICQSCKIYQEA